MTLPLQLSRASLIKFMKDWIDQAGGVPLGGMLPPHSSAECLLMSCLEIIRSYQAFTLYRELQLVKLMIFRDRPYNLFDNQVLAT